MFILLFTKNKKPLLALSNVHLKLAVCHEPNITERSFFVKHLINSGIFSTSLNFKSPLFKPMLTGLIYEV